MKLIIAILHATAEALNAVNAVSLAMVAVLAPDVLRELRIEEFSVACDRWQRVRYPKPPATIIENLTAMRDELLAEARSGEWVKRRYPDHLYAEPEDTSRRHSDDRPNHTTSRV